MSTARRDPAAPHLPDRSPSPARPRGASGVGRWLRTLAAAALVASAATPVAAQQKPAAAEPVKLTLAPRKGDVVAWRYQRSDRSRLADDTADRVLEYESSWTCTVADAPSGGPFLLDVTFGPAKGRFTGAAGVVEFDTAAPATAPADEGDRMRLLGMTFLAGTKARVELDATGRVIRVEGVAEAARRAVAGTPLASDPALSRADFGLSEMREKFPSHPEPQRPPGAVWVEKTPALIGSLRVDLRSTWTMKPPTPAEVTAERDFAWVPEAKAGEARRNEHTGKGADVWSAVDGLLVRSTVSVKVVRSGKTTGQGTMEQTIERTTPVPSPAGTPAAASSGKPATPGKLPAGGPKVKFGFAAKPGTKLSFRYTRASASKIVETGTESVDDLTQEYAISVKSLLPDGGAVLDVTFGRCSGRFRTAAGIVEFDSDAKAPLPTDPMAKVRVLGQTCFIGKAVAVTVNARGVPVASPAAVETFFAAFAGQDLGPIEDLRRVLDDADVVKIVAEVFVPAPDGTRTPGESWSVETSRKLGSIDTGFTETTTLGAVAGGVAPLTETFAYKPAAAAPKAQTNAAEGKGECTWSVADGLPVAVRRTWKITSNGALTAEGTRTETLERVKP